MVASHGRVATVSSIMPIMALQAIQAVTACGICSCVIRNENRTALVIW